MADKPLVLTKPNVCAVLERRKFHTRRIINPQPVMEKIESFGESWAWRKSNKDWFSGVTLDQMLSDKGLLYPGRLRYQVGDRAYVAEGYQIRASYTIAGFETVSGIYLADDKRFRITLTKSEADKWNERKRPFHKTPGRFMYKSLARIFLPIVEVRVEMLQDISEEDAKAEGVYPITNYRTETPYKDAFRWLWCSIHDKGTWDRNDWVFCYTWDEIIIKGE